MEIGGWLIEIGRGRIEKTDLGSSWFNTEYNFVHLYYSTLKN